ncbi:MAG TPA: helix-turn-helix domain-containing protein [Candidatus Limnocylindrales bacterium]|nr:helix-turn-helix domain-containing protein [Candidatus Limnocylindrales bacterium]
MPDDVKPRRAYRSTRRAEHAAQTRRDILSAAGALFRERGYGGTSIPLIAREAGVAVETIYRAFGSKTSLFTAVVEAVIAGGAQRAEVPVEERPAIRAIIEEPDPRRQVERYVATQPGIHRRSGPLLRALREAAHTDPALLRLWNELEAARLNGQGRLVDRLADEGALRTDLSREDARDIVWTLCSLAVRDLLVQERGWSDARYEAWLARTLIAQLIDPAPSGTDRPARSGRAREEAVGREP